VAAILEAFDRAKFMSIDGRTFPAAYDAPHVTISLSVDGKSHKVRCEDLNGHYHLPVTALLFNRTAREQVRFSKLADEFESLVGWDRWTKCSPKCMALVRVPPGAMIDSRGPDGSVPLLRAIQSKTGVSWESMDFDAHTLIEAGSDVNASNKQGVTPLMAAAKNSDVDLIHDLLAHGADLNGRDKKGLSAATTRRHRKSEHFYPAAFETWRKNYLAGNRNVLLLFHHPKVSTWLPLE
jgi:hypothetical protein